MKMHYETETVLTCPGCGHSSTEKMPLDACVYFYECQQCQKLLTPESGDCCVFCSHGTTLCPTSQRERHCYSVLAPKHTSANEESISRETCYNNEIASRAG